MTKSQRDRRERLWLLRLASMVALEMRAAPNIPDLFVSPLSQLKTEKANTDGWYVNLGRVRPDRGSALQIWLDRWPTLTSRKVFVCYKGTRVEQIRRVSSAASGSLGRAVSFTDKAWHHDRKLGFAHLKSPLPSHMYGVPIAELYEASGSWAFYGMYFRQTGSFNRKPSKILARRIRRFLDLTAKSILAQVEIDRTQDYSALENRSKVVQHVRRERSRLLTEKAKLRDGYTCQVCELSFESRYGRLGRGFAEAHHRVSLSKLRAGIRTHLKDLVTVCANCHRMLHKMKGNYSDVTTLRRTVHSRQ